MNFFEFSKRNNFKHALACVHFSLMTPLFIKRQWGEHTAALFDSLKDRWKKWKDLQMSSKGWEKARVYFCALNMSVSDLSSSCPLILVHLWRSPLQSLCLQSLLLLLTDPIGWGLNSTWEQSVCSCVCLLLVDRDVVMSPGPMQLWG